MKILSKITPQSRKLIVLLISVVAYIANDLLKKPISEATMLQVLALVGAYIIGQGIADHGSQGAAIAAERAVKKSKEVSNAVNAVLTLRKGPEKPAEGPGWEDTSAQDEEDKGENQGP